jgi:hypothetical protein
MTLSLFATEGGEHPTVTGGLVELSESQTGDISLSSYVTACQRQGYSVFAPCGDGYTADLCVVKKRCVPMLAQVKTANKDRPNSYHIGVGKGSSSKVAYKPGDFHILAAYLPDRNEFVMFTFEDIRGRVTLRYNPEKHHQPSNWHLLDEVGKTLNSSWGSTAIVLP